MLFKKNKPRYDITFICRRGKSHFAEPILKELEKKYSIQYLYPEHKREYSHAQVEGWVIWVEWASKFARLVSKKRWKERKIFVRIHRYEIEKEFIREITWINIDKIIFVNSHFEGIFRQSVDENVNTITIPNALNVEAFNLHPVKNTKKLLAYSLTFNPIKRYVDLLHFFSKLLHRDDEFRLTILARNALSQSEIEYLEKIKACIDMLGIRELVTIIEREASQELINDRKNINSYLSAHDAVISYSELESFHYAFAEGLVCGLQGFYNAWKNPLIKDFWGKWGYNSEDEMLQGIVAWSNLPLWEKQNISKANREYVINNFGSENISRIYEREFFH